MTQVREPAGARRAILARTLSGLAIAGATAGLLAAGAASAKVEGDTVILGSANSLTGKYSSNGIDTQNGYDLAIKVINEMGGVTDRKSTRLTPVTNAHLVCRLLLEKKNNKTNKI